MRTAACVQHTRQQGPASGTVASAKADAVAAANGAGMKGGAEFHGDGDGRVDPQPESALLISTHKPVMPSPASAGQPAAPFRVHLTGECFGRGCQHAPNRLAELTNLLVATACPGHLGKSKLTSMAHSDPTSRSETRAGVTQLLAEYCTLLDHGAIR